MFFFKIPLVHRGLHLFMNFTCILFQLKSLEIIRSLYYFEIRNISLLPEIFLSIKMLSFHHRKLIAGFNSGFLVLGLNPLPAPSWWPSTLTTLLSISKVMALSLLFFSSYLKTLKLISRASGRFCR